jgi:hypothetical protein
MPRYLAWKILSSTELDHKCIYIVSGTSDKLTEKIDGKLKKLFEKRFPLLRLESKFTDLWLKKHGSKYYQSHLMDIELYDTANFFIDEADYLGHMDQELLDQAISLYADKNSCKTIIASTPNSP